MSAKRIAIIGAGPGGLVCAHKLLTLTPHSITIFDKAQHVGGLWEHNSLINPDMQVNLCRFTMAFSDLSWKSVDLGRPAPVYPQAWMVERYLQAYSQRYIPELNLELETCVQYVRKIKDKWQIIIRKRGKTEAQMFDYLVVATGYLSTPRALNCKIDERIRIPLLHSTEYRSLEQLLPHIRARHNECCRILVIGGSHSGADVSALLAKQISNENWTPSRSSKLPKVDIFHITHNEMYAAPRLLRDRSSDRATFYPLEFTLCERASRGPDPISFTFKLADQNQNQEIRALYQAFVEEVTNDKQHNKHDKELPPYTIVSDTYPLLVKCGLITPIIGVVKELEYDAISGLVSAAVIGNDGNFQRLDHISAVINATGFDSSGSLSFLSDELKSQLELDQSNVRLPLVLDDSYMSQHSSIRDIAFIGLTPVNWGIMEMQSRAIAARWTDTLPPDTSDNTQALADHMRTLRNAIKTLERRKTVPHYLFGDYVGLMEQAGRELKTVKINGKYDDFSGFICSSRYVGVDEDRTEAVKTITDIQELHKRINTENYLLAKVCFLSLIGSWRGQDNREGIATMYFLPRNSTSTQHDLEYLCIINRDNSSTKERRLVLRYSEVTDELSLWSVSEEDELSTDKFLSIFNFTTDDFGNVQGFTDKASDFLSLQFCLFFKSNSLEMLHVDGKAWGIAGFVQFIRHTPASPNKQH
jgi:cation diffusion facilitator CzcD-associated flavoprotein CzcO